jgi:hypothetical protein
LRSPHRDSGADLHAPAGRPFRRVVQAPGAFDQGHDRSSLLELDTAGSPTAEGVYLLYAGTATIGAHIAAGRLRDVPQGLNPATLAPYALGDSILLSQISITVAGASAAALPFAEELNQGERGNDVTLYYDLIVTPASGPIYAFMAGKFTDVAGVTIP